MALMLVIDDCARDGMAMLGTERQGHPGHTDMTKTPLTRKARWGMYIYIYACIQLPCGPIPPPCLG
eukprot:8620954-Karenia_brevis.AAC.1